MKKIKLLSTILGGGTLICAAPIIATSCGSSQQKDPIVVGDYEIVNYDNCKISVDTTVPTNPKFIVSVSTWESTSIKFVDKADGTATFSLASGGTGLSFESDNKTLTIGTNFDEFGTAPHSTTIKSSAPNSASIAITIQREYGYSTTNPEPTIYDAKSGKYYSVGTVSLYKNGVKITEDLNMLSLNYAMSGSAGLTSEDFTINWNSSSYEYEIKTTDSYTLKGTRYDCYLVANINFPIGKKALPFDFHAQKQ